MKNELIQKFKELLTTEDITSIKQEGRRGFYLCRK